MARIRTIKPEFWTDEKTGTLSDFSKCLFLGLLNHSDDFGVVEWRPMEWRIKIFPYHSDTTTVAVDNALVDELLPRGLVVLFSRDNEDGLVKKFLFIRHFDKHQVINKPSRPLLSGWKKSDTPETYARRNGDEFQSLSADGLGTSHSTTTPLPEPSRLEGKGKEGKGKEEDTSLRSVVNVSCETTERYEFESGVIRLTSKDFKKWKESFSFLDLKAELLSLTPWANEQGEKWFFAVSAALAKRNREQKIKLETAKGSNPSGRHGQNDPLAGII